MLSMIRETLPMQETLDWRMAFLELSQMISEAQEGVKRPPELSIKCGHSLIQLITHNVLFTLQFLR